MMKLEERIDICSDILIKYLPFISQLDLVVIENFKNRFQHKWFEQLSLFSQDDITKFDAFRDYQILKDKEWISLIKQIQIASTLDSVGPIETDLTCFGNEKKKHELSMLYSYFNENNSINSSILDFGGGVGNLAFFLEDKLGMNPTVIEKDAALIEKGRQRALRENKKTTFKQLLINETSSIINLASNQIGIGLHTCGNFAIDMIESCCEIKLDQIINFGCCYSKIENDCYNLSNKSNKTLKFNNRALSSATLSFGKTSLDIYKYRLRIQDYKYSFYNLIYYNYQLLRFFPMSNSRRSLYNLSFNDFFLKCLKKYYPNLSPIDRDEINSFYHSSKNRELNKYFKIYYAISRYIGEVLEIYLLCDRALYLQEKGYTVEIKEFFDPGISPRNKAILAKRL